MIFTDELPKLEEINSEFIEPYLKRFLSIQIESCAYGVNPVEIRANLKGVEFFISCFGAIHSRYAVNNEYNRVINLSDEDMIKICKQVYND